MCCVGLIHAWIERSNERRTICYFHKEKNRYILMAILCKLRLCNAMRKSKARGKVGAAWLAVENSKKRQVQVLITQAFALRRRE